MVSCFYSAGGVQLVNQPRSRSQPVLVLPYQRSFHPLLRDQIPTLLEARLLDPHFLSYIRHGALSCFAMLILLTDCSAIISLSEVSNRTLTSDQLRRRVLIPCIAVRQLAGLIKCSSLRCTSPPQVCVLRLSYTQRQLNLTRNLTVFSANRAYALSEQTRVIYFAVLVLSLGPFFVNLVRTLRGMAHLGMKESGLLMLVRRCQIDGLMWVRPVNLPPPALCSDDDSTPLSVNLM